MLPARMLESSVAMVMALLTLSCSPGDTRTRARADEADALRRHHQTILDAHRNGTVEPWLGLEAEDYVSANRGTISFPSLEERRQARKPYLEGTSFEYYRDVRDPVVLVSDDGSLGWLIAQVEASGVRRLADGTEEPIRFVAAWIELYEKRAGEWVMVGNVSNTQPQEAR